jgi:hypothetical protein
LTPSAKIEFAIALLEQLRSRIPYIPPDLVESETLAVFAQIGNTLDPEGKCTA